MTHDLRYRLTRLVPMLLLAVVSACIPVPRPHTITLQPDMEGVVTLDGRPMKDTAILLGSLGCEEVSARTVTDADGRFVFERIDQDRLIYPLPMVPLHKLYAVTVCIEHGGTVSPIYTATAYTLYEKGLGPLPEIYRLDCRLTSTQLAGPVEEARPLCSAKTEGGWQS